MLMGPGRGAPWITAGAAAGAIAGAVLVVRGGDAGSAPAWAAGAALMAGAWGAALRAIARRPARAADHALVWIGALLIGSVFVFSPGPRSAEGTALLARGRVLGVVGANPYTIDPARSGGDAIPGSVAEAPVATHAAPGLTSTAAVATRLGGESPARGLLILRLMMLALHLVNGALVWRLAAGWDAGRHVRPARAALFLLWNPLILIASIAEIHGGGVALFWLLTALLLIRRRDPIMAAACGGMAAAVAWLSVPALGILAAHRARESGRPAALGFVAVAAAVIALSFLPYLPGFPAGALPAPWLAAETTGGGIAAQAGSLAGTIGVAPAGAARATLVTIAWVGIGFYLLALVRRGGDLPERLRDLVRILLIAPLVGGIAGGIAPGAGDVILAAGIAACLAPVAERRAAAFACLALLLPALPVPLPAAAWIGAVAPIGPITYILLRFGRRPRTGPAAFVGEEERRA